MMIITNIWKINNVPNHQPDFDDLGSIHCCDIIWRRHGKPLELIAASFQVAKPSLGLVWLSRSEPTDPLRILRRWTDIEINADFPK